MAILHWVIFKTGYYKKKKKISFWGVETRREDRHGINCMAHLLAQDRGLWWVRTYLGDCISWKIQCSGSTMVQVPDFYILWRIHGVKLCLRVSLCQDRYSDKQGCLWWGLGFSIPLASACFSLGHNWLLIGLCPCYIRREKITNSTS